MSEPQTPRWTLVTVTYNSADALRRCWSDRVPDGHRWLIVDNASTDDTVAVAEELGAAVVPLSRNVGFSAANNIGLSKAATDHVAFVNPDVGVDFKSMPILADILDRHDMLVAPQLINPDGSIQPSGRGLPFLVDKFAHRGLRLPGARLNDYLPSPTETRPYIAWSMGAAITGRRETLLRLGGWDASFFLYYEDHDLGLRAWRSGVPVIMAPQVRWTHEWARDTASLKATPWAHEFRSAIRFYTRYPELILPLRKIAARRHDRYTAHSGTGTRSQIARMLRDPNADREPQ